MAATEISAARGQCAAFNLPGWLAAGRFRRLGTRLLGLKFGFFFAHAKFA